MLVVFIHSVDSHICLLKRRDILVNTVSLYMMFIVFKMARTYFGSWTQELGNIFARSFYL